MHLHAHGTSVADLRTGDHGCLTYASQTEQFNTLAPFVEDGLRLNERVLYVGDEEHGALARDVFSTEDASALACGQLLIEDSSRTYLRGGRFHPERMMYHYQSAERRARALGYSALRVAADMSWAQSQQIGSLVRYEDELNDALSGRSAIVVCLYDRRRFQASTLADLQGVHPLAVNPNPVYETRALRIYRGFDPHALALAGEIDISNREAFKRALDELLGAPEERLEVDLTRVTFMDVTSITALGLAARDLGRGRLRVIANARLRDLFAIALPHIATDLEVELRD